MKKFLKAAERFFSTDARFVGWDNQKIRKAAKEAIAYYDEVKDFISAISDASDSFYANLAWMGHHQRFSPERALRLAQEAEF